jgi:N-acetylglucosaminyldiphosphoundecaprenol N-acetyl-beta-D-mannosaminyltransferase
MSIHIATPGTGESPAGKSGAVAERKVSVGRTDVDVLEMSDAVGRIVRWAQEPGPTRIVVTPNIQHIDLLAGSAEFRAAYAGADMVLPDGWPVAVVAGLLARRRVSRVAGSDLAVQVVSAAAAAGVSVGFFGGAGDNAATAADRCVSAHRELVVAQVETMAPAEIDRPDYSAQMRLRLEECAPQIVLLGLGAPKQEVFADRHLRDSAARVVLCVGASLDFLAGAKRRAPRAVQRLGMEWFWRLALEPRRLAGRYATSAMRFPLHVVAGLQVNARRSR